MKNEYMGAFAFQVTLIGGGENHSYHCFVITLVGSRGSIGLF